MSVNLCVDWGNTNVKSSIIVDNKVTQTVVTDPANALAKISALIELTHPEKAILCAVGDVKKDIVKLLDKQVSNFIDMDGYTRLPIHNAYLSNDTVGADRLALVTAAFEQYPEKNNLVICLGTCITYNFVTRNKTFRGGAISPGMNMRLKAMHQFTDRLPETDAEGDLLLLGYDTATCMRSGAIYGMACEIDGMIAEYENSFPDFNAILTGGDAAFFAGRLKSKIFADPDLLMKGLNLILNYNVPFPR